MKGNLGIGKLNMVVELVCEVSKDDCFLTYNSREDYAGILHCKRTIRGCHKLR